MRIKDLLKPEAIQIGGSATSKDDAIDKLVALMCKEGNVSDVEGYKAAVRAREAEGTTGMMEGFAIPHAKSDAISEAAVIVVKDESGVTGWDTMDGAPVNVAIALLIPGAQAGTTHLKILSKVAEALMDEDFRATVKGSTDAAEIAKTINARLV